MAPKYEILDVERVDGREGSNVVTVEARCRRVQRGLIDEPALKRAFEHIRSDAAKGVDGVSKEQYGQNLNAKLRDLHERLKSKRYRHQAIRRVHIPKENGKTRPIGVSTSEDKVV